MKKSKTNSGVLSFIEKIVRSHPLVYITFRYLIKFTNIFEEDAFGLKKINFKNKINIIDVGASDGIASKFFINNLNVNKIICYEPNESYIKYLKKNTKLIVKPYALGEKNEIKYVYIPRYFFFSYKFDLDTYAHYNKQELLQQIKLDFKFLNNIKVIKKKFKIKKINYINYKIDLIKIDVNGHEFSIVKGLIHVIKRDKPVLLIESTSEIEKINNILKKIGYSKFTYNNRTNKFINIKKIYPLNTFFLQKRHF